MKKYDYILVEDNQEDIELIQEAIETLSQNFSCLTIRDGEEAYRFFEQEVQAGSPAPRVIILDLKLPKISGFDILKLLKSSDKTAGIPVVALTSSNSMNDMLESYKMGINAYVIKPIGFEEFIQVVQSLSKFWLIHNTLP